MSVYGDDIRKTETMPFPSGQDAMFANIINIQTVPGQKKLSVSAINPLPLKSDVLEANLTIVNEIPSKSGQFCAKIC